MLFVQRVFSEEQLRNIDEAAKHIPVFKSANMSVGINLLSGLLKKAATALGENFDVEIVERHHKSKLDAPSGTALMLADSVAAALPLQIGICVRPPQRQKTEG